MAITLKNTSSGIYNNIIWDKNSNIMLIGISSDSFIYKNGVYTEKSIGRLDNKSLTFI
jgi:hypothetical protein